MKQDGLVTDTEKERIEKITIGGLLNIQFIQIAFILSEKYLSRTIIGSIVKSNSNCDCVLSLSTVLGRRSS